MSPNELARERYVSLATFKRSGAEAKTPIWFASDPQDPRKLWMYTNAKSWKVKRIRNNGRARVAACGVRGKVHGPWLEASARVATDERTLRRTYELLLQKYGLMARLALLASRLSGTAKEHAILEVTLT